jgi:signal transduction histidine kinase
VRIVREHPVRAATQVGRLGNLLWVARILETHHERYNGWGYPFGLKGDEIPFPAVLLGIAEAYLALTTPRPYRPRARTPAEALAHLRAQSGEQFHPRAVETLERALESGALVEFDEPAAHRLVEEAVGRLRRATAAPRLPSNISSRWLGSDPWTEAGGLQAILRALFPSWTALHVHRRAADWYRSLYELGQIFSSSLDEESLASQAAQAVYNLTTLPCEVCLVGADGESLETSAIRGLPRNAVSGFDRGIRHGLSGVAFAEGRPVVSVDAGTDPRVRNRVKVRELGVKSCVVVPLAAGGVPLGTITVYSPTVRSFSPVEVQVLAAIANLAALALQNAALYRKAGDRLVRLVRTQRFLQTILDTAPVGIVAFDSAGALSLVNRVGGSYLAALGFETGSGGEVLTLFLGELQDRLGLEGAAGECAEGWERAGPVTVTVDITAGEASFQVWSSPLEGELSGGPGTLLILDDVTEAKRLEDEVRRTERLAAVGEIAAKAAHEIRNPLSSLQGFSQLLALYCPVKEQWPECNAFVERVESEVERLEEIVQSMLVMARPTPKTIERADLTTPALEALAMLSGRASELGVSLQGPQCPAGVLADFDFRQQKQVVLNLVQNALDAVGGPGGPPPGERRVEVSVGYERRGKRRLAVLRVWDNGPGIRPGDENKIFTPFFTTKHTGTGLGLSVSRGIIEAHGGELRWQPVKGQGAVFEVLLPAPDPGRSD